MISIVIPVYNSEKTISKLCQNIIKVMTDHHLAFEIVLVDDRSHDQSYQKMQILSKTHQQITSIRLKENYGQQNALLCGLRYAKGDYVVTMDDDCQQDPEDIILLLNMLKQGYDVVYGIPYENSKKQYRHRGTQLKEFIFRTLLGKPKDIKLTSYRIMNKDTVEKIKKETVSHVYLSATILKHTKNIGNKKVRYYDRVYGQSNYTLKKLIHLLLHVVIYYGQVPFFRRLRQQKPQYIVDEMVNDSK